MSQQISKDMRQEYQEMQICALRDNAEHYKNRCIALIERCSAAEAERNGLRHKLEDAESDLRTVNKAIRRSADLIHKNQVLKALEWLDAVVDRLDTEQRIKATKAALRRQDEPSS